MRIKLHIQTDHLNAEQQELYFRLFKYDDPLIESDFEPRPGDVITLADYVYPPDNISQYRENFGNAMRIIVKHRELWLNKDLWIDEATYCCRLLTDLRIALRNPLSTVYHRY